jgi:hypothetical protein
MAPEALQQQASQSCLFWLQPLLNGSSPGEGGTKALLKITEVRYNAGQRSVLVGVRAVLKTDCV